MSVSRRLRTSVLVAVAVLLSTVTVAVAMPAHRTAPRAAVAADTNTNAAAAATTYNGYASRVVGHFGNRGTVRGSFVPVRSYVAGGRTVVQGELLATLRRANGSLVAGVTRHDVAIPVHASGAHSASAFAAPATASAAASCTILHLVLGPLDLNLLGLMVHLDRVVLDITAQSGAGNLLGNLLCAVAHLLDGTSPSLLSLLRLANGLTRIIGAVT